jgi:hypothetical protein
MNVFKKTVTLAAALSLVCLSSAGAMAANKLIVKDSGGTIDKFVVTDNGFIGSGTNAPAVAIHATGSNSSASQLRAHFNGSSAAGGGSFVMLHNNGSTSLLPLNNDRIGAMYFGTQTTSGMYYGAGISIFASGAWTNTGTLATSAMPAYISFDTAPATGAKVERLRITSAGNVGVGTNAPNQKLQINGGLRLSTGTARPTCTDATNRGTIWATQGASGVADTVAVCTKDAANNYGWRALY